MASRQRLASWPIRPIWASDRSGADLRGAAGNQDL